MDGFEHPVHIPKREDQPEQKEEESKIGYWDILGWSSSIAGVCIVMAFVWNFLADKLAIHPLINPLPSYSFRNRWGTLLPVSKGFVGEGLVAIHCLCSLTLPWRGINR